MLTLKHKWYKQDWFHGFYNYSAWVKKGVIELPLERSVVISAFYDGFRLTPEGDELKTVDQVIAYAFPKAVVEFAHVNDEEQAPPDTSIYTSLPVESDTVTPGNDTLTDGEALVG